MDGLDQLVEVLFELSLETSQSWYHLDDFIDALAVFDCLLLHDMASFKHGVADHYRAIESALNILSLAIDDHLHHRRQHGENLHTNEVFYQRSQLVFLSPINCLKHLLVVQESRIDNQPVFHFPLHHCLENVDRGTESSLDHLEHLFRYLKALLIVWAHAHKALP